MVVKGMFMITVYCYDKCSTCQKALKWLDDNGVAYKKLDIKTQHPDEKLLRSLHKASNLPLKKFFNTSGILYREMKLAEKLPTMSEDEQLALLATEGMLVKRPLLVTDKTVIPGFKDTAWREAVK